MNTIFLIMAKYDGLAVIPVERVYADYFSHLTPKKMKMKVAAGEIDLPLIRMENSQKAARGVHLNDLAKYIDRRRNLAKTEHDMLLGREREGVRFRSACFLLR